MSVHPNTGSALQTVLGALDPSHDARFYKPRGMTSSDPDFIADKYTRPPVINRSRATEMLQEYNRTGIQFPGMRLNLGKTPRMMSRDIPTNHSGDPNHPTPGSVHPMPNLGSGAPRVPIRHQQEGGGILKQAFISNVALCCLCPSAIWSKGY